MSEAKPNRIAHFRRLRKLSQQQLADAVDAHWVTISKLERGRIKLTQDWLGKLSKALTVTEFDLLSDERPYRTVFLDGMVFPGGEIGWEKDDPGSLATDIELDTGNSETGLWFAVIGDAFKPFFHEGDILRVSPYDHLKIEECLGRMCFVNLKVSGVRQYFGVLEQGEIVDRYNLKRFNAPTIKNVLVEDVMLLTQAVIRPPGS